MSTIKADFDALAQRIKMKAEGKKILYIANPGNFGDGLIKYSTKTFFDDYDIEHEEIYVGINRPWYFLLPFMISAKIKKQDCLFIYGGGGAWCKVYDDGQRLCTYLDKWGLDYMSLPSTYEKNIDKLKGTLHFRDEFESKNNCPQGHFCHDMAFYLTTKDSDTIPFHSNQGSGVGILMRTDQESRIGRDQSLPSRNIDISTLGNHSSNVDQFFRIVSQYEAIVTDRLHVAIAGVILGKKVDLFTGSYFKIRRIYESSIAPYFDSITMHGDEVNLEKFLEGKK